MNKYVFSIPTLQSIHSITNQSLLSSQMSIKVAEMLKHDPLKLRFTQSNGQNGTPKSIIRRQANLTVSELIQPSYMSTNNNLLYYELLDVSIIELETKKSLKITWINASNKEDGTHSFLLPKNTTMHEVAQESLRKNVKLSEEGSGQIRIFEIHSGRVQKTFSGSEAVRDVQDQIELFAEEIPVDEAKATEADRIVNCYHFFKDAGRAHGIPFKFVIKPVSFFSLFLSLLFLS